MSGLQIWYAILTLVGIFMLYQISKGLTLAWSLYKPLSTHCIQGYALLLATLAFTAINAYKLITVK